jgi:signal peptidase I
MTVWLNITAAVLLLAASVVVALRYFRRSRTIVTVDGDSMAPAFPDGTELLVRRQRSGPVATGEVVAFIPEFAEGAAPQGDGQLWLIKRVAAAEGEPVPAGLDPALTDMAGQLVPDGQMVVLGDNLQHSVDSRQEGLISLDRLRGIVIEKLSDSPDHYAHNG